VGRVAGFVVVIAVVIAAAGCGSGRVAPGASRAGRWRVPPGNAVFDYQIGGAYQPAKGVGIVDRDRGDKPAAGVYGICYVNAFQTQPEEDGWWRAHHPELLVTRGGKAVEDPGWPGELVLDTSTGAKRQALAGIVGGWIDGCARAGYQGVEPDNLDSWSRSDGALDQADNVAFAALLVARAHADGLAIGQKNTPELGSAGRSKVGFDFAIAEECEVYHECDAYTTVYGNEVFEIEYTDNGGAAFTRACAARGATISVLLRDRDVVRAGDPAYHNQTC
jgi:glycosyl hydrolase family 114